MPTLRLIVLVLFVLFWPATGHAADAGGAPEGSLWPVWGAATLQIAGTLLAGVILAFHRRARDLDGDRVTDLKTRVGELEVLLARTREEVVARGEVFTDVKARLVTVESALAGAVSREEANSRFQRLHEALKSHQKDTADTFREVRAEIKAIGADVTAVLKLLTAER